MMQVEEGAGTFSPLPCSFDACESTTPLNFAPVCQNSYRTKHAAGIAAMIVAWVNQKTH